MKLSTFLPKLLVGQEPHRNMLEMKFHMKKVSLETVTNGMHGYTDWEVILGSRKLVSSRKAMAQKELRFDSVSLRASVLPLHSFLII